jgi:hypothetical protein
LNAPCDGITTDNEISNLGQRRAEIEQQIAALEDTAQQNDMSPAIIRDAPEILAAAQTPLTPAGERSLLAERQARLADELSATQNELAGMSEQATAPIARTRFEKRSTKPKTPRGRAAPFSLSVAFSSQAKSAPFDRKLTVRCHRDGLRSM